MKKCPSKPKKAECWYVKDVNRKYTTPAISKLTDDVELKVEQKDALYASTYEEFALLREKITHAYNTYTSHHGDIRESILTHCALDKKLYVGIISTV